MSVCCAHAEESERPTHRLHVKGQNTMEHARQERARTIRGPLTDLDRIATALYTRADRFDRNALSCQRVGNRDGERLMRAESGATRALLHSLSELRQEPSGASSAPAEKSDEAHSLDRPSGSGTRVQAVRASGCNPGPRVELGGTRKSYRFDGRDHSTRHPPGSTGGR